MTKRPKRALLFWVRAVPRVSVVASIRATRFAPREAGFSAPRLLRRHDKPRDLANTSKRGRFWFHTSYENGATRSSFRGHTSDTPYPRKVWNEKRTYFG